MKGKGTKVRRGEGTKEWRDGGMKERKEDGTKGRKKWRNQGLMKCFHTCLQEIDRSRIRFYPKHILTLSQYDPTFVLLQMKEQYPKPLTCWGMVLYETLYCQEETWWLIRFPSDTKKGLPTLLIYFLFPDIEHGAFSFISSFLIKQTLTHHYAPETFKIWS